jgi:type II secretory pathway component PulJ
MARLPILSLILAVLAVSGCDDLQRTARLERENADLKAQLKERDAQLQEKDVSRNYELEARCSKDARVWFNQNYSRDKDTMLLTFSNHYHVASNQCYIFVEYHWKQGVGESWMNDISLWNVYENDQVGTFLEDHIINFKPTDFSKISTCEVYGSKCTTIDQFNGLVQPYMNN